MDESIYTTGANAGPVKEDARVFALKMHVPLLCSPQAYECHPTGGLRKETFGRIRYIRLLIDELPVYKRGLACLFCI